MKTSLLLLLSTLVTLIPSSQASKETTRVGSKTFTESYILAEIVSQVIETQNPDVRVDRKFGLGGTGIIYEALRSGSIDLYPEYTGTISEAILKDPSIKDPSTIAKALSKQGITLSNPLGFNNTYAIAVRRTFAEQNHLESLTDLRNLRSIRAGFSHEFMNRSDGYLGLKKRLNLKFDFVRSMEHSLSYEAIGQGQIDITDAYATDSKIQKFDLILLRDDLHFFPDYSAVILARTDFVKRHPSLWMGLNTRLERKISESQIARLNGMADLEGKSFAEIASDYLQIQQPFAQKARPSIFWKRTRQHLFLVGIALLASVIVGLPLGILSAKSNWSGHFIIAISGLLQTIPSIALLCFLIPLFGVGTPPALLALFFYGLFPIVVGTYSGLRSLDPKLLESADAIGLTQFQRLKWIEIPLASPAILTGVRTAAVISIGTATLAAFIGAGGYGAPIVTGLALNDIPTILSGAIPAAGLAILAHLFFEGLSRWLIPRGLRKG